MKKNIYTLAEALSKKEISSYELTATCLEKIEADDEKIGAYLTVCKDFALETAARSDSRRAKGMTLGILDGIPFSL